MKFADVRKYVKGLLSSSFVNKTVLDKLGEDDNNNLTYNGAAIEGGGGNASEIYSKTEQKIGTWIDGRTLYSCTYHIESLPGANESITFGSRKYHKIISFEGFASHKEVDWFFPLPYIDASNEKIIIDSVADGDESKCIRITATTDRSNVEAWVTVKYTAVERDTDGKPELEFSTAGEQIITINYRHYYKKNNDLAIGGWAYYGGWYAPWLISRTMEGSMYYTNDGGGGNSSNTNSLEYEGETWYYSCAYYAFSYCDSSGNGRGLYLNDIEGIKENIDTSIVKAILDYYFYHS